MESVETERNIEAKVVVLGSQGVGKTSIVQRHITGDFNRHQTPTIGASYFSCKMCIDNTHVRLQVWDTAGQERFRSMAPMYYRNASAAMLVYDITSRSSFVAMQSWVTELKRNVENHVVLVMLGNKCDLEDMRIISKDEAEGYATKIGARHFATSALSQTGIQEVFVEIAQALLRVDAHKRGSVAHSLDSLVLDENRIRLQDSREDTMETEASAAARSGCCRS